MPEQLQTIPKINADAQIKMTLDYNDSGSVATAVYVISKFWKDNNPEKLEELKRLLENKEPITEIEHHTLLCLDLLYKKIVKAAKDQGMTTEIELKDAFSTF